MAELLELYPWARYLPTVLLLLLVVGHRILAKYGYFKVRCPNCKVFNAYKVTYASTGFTTTRTSVSRHGIPHEVEYKRLELAYTCTACGHKWQTTEDRPA